MHWPHSSHRHASYEIRWGNLAVFFHQQRVPLLMRTLVLLLISSEVRTHKNTTDTPFLGIGTHTYSHVLPLL